jgi:hypothetical protein
MGREDVSEIISEMRPEGEETAMKEPREQCSWINAVRL